MDAVVWKQAIYFNNFKCTKCGTSLLDKDNNFISDEILVNEHEVKNFEKGKIDSFKCFCPKCKDYVAYVAKVDSKDDDSNKNTVLKCGNFEDYLKKKGMLN